MDTEVTKHKVFATHAPDQPHNDFKLKFLSTETKFLTGSFRRASSKLQDLLYSIYFNFKQSHNNFKQSHNLKDTSYPSHTIEIEQQSIHKSTALRYDDNYKEVNLRLGKSFAELSQQLHKKIMVGSMLYSDMVIVIDRRHYSYRE